MTRMEWTACMTLGLAAGCGSDVPAVDFDNSLAVGTAPLRVHFTDRSSDEATSWLWHFGDGGTSDLKNPVYVYRKRGTYTVSLDVGRPGALSTKAVQDCVRVEGSSPRDNVLIILADDLSPADLACYGMNPDLAPNVTPNIDSLAGQGVLFERAWANPICSASRAALLTGRHAFRTGIGTAIENGGYSLPLSELTLPEALEAYSDTGYAHAAFGKWHLDSEQDTWELRAGAGDHGFDFFDGTPSQIMDYCNWRHVTYPDDEMTTSSVYMTEYTVDTAISWIRRQEGPWFCYLGPQAPYQLLHVPPAHLQDIVSGTTCGDCDQRDRRCFDASLQALDTKIGHLLAALGPNWREDTTIIFTGDNGTPNNVLEYWPPRHGKASLYEGGLSVPLIIAGLAVDPRLRGTRTSSLVQLTDLYRTVTELTGAETLPGTAGQDSVSLLPLLEFPPRPTERTTLFAERFHPNGLPPYQQHSSAMRNGRYKLIYNHTTGVQRLFDLATDPLELQDLAEEAPPAPGTPAGEALERLKEQLLALVEV